MEEENCIESIKLKLEEIYGFNDKNHKNYFECSAPPTLGYYTEVIVDLRFGKSITVNGKRGNEIDVLFKGTISTFDELSIIYSCIIK